MMLEVGQYVNDGNNDLLVCATREYKGNWYAYLLNEETDSLSFFQFTLDNEIYEFTEIIDESLLKELILVFAKDYTEKNPDVLKEIEELNNINIEDEKEDE